MEAGILTQAAIEVCGRAGGLIPSKLIGEPQFGEFEAVEGNAFYLMRKVDIRPDDIFILISNSGRNPMTIEMADYIKKKGQSADRGDRARLCRKRPHPAIPRVSSSMNSPTWCWIISRSSEMRRWTSRGLDCKVCGTSSFAGCLLLQQTMYEAIRDMAEKGYAPPVYKSANIDGGPDFNHALEAEYSADRIWHK